MTLGNNIALIPTALCIARPATAHHTTDDTVTVYCAAELTVLGQSTAAGTRHEHNGQRGWLVEFAGVKLWGPEVRGAGCNWVLLSAFPGSPAAPRA